MQPYLYVGLGVRLSDLTREDFDDVTDGSEYEITWYTESSPYDRNGGVIFIEDCHFDPWDNRSQQDANGPWCESFSTIEKIKPEWLATMPGKIEGTLLEKYKDKIQLYVCTTEV